MKNGWKKVKLIELGFVGRGKSKHRPRNEPSLYGGQYPFIQTGEIKAADLYISDYSKTYNEKGLAQSKLWQPGTLCITIAANIAETAILKIPACFPDSVVGFVADSKKSDIRFVKYYIDILKLSMQNVSKGTTQDNLSVDKLLTFDFIIPEVDTQRKIASILSAYDDLIENNTRRIKILEEIAQAIYREWFVEFRFPGVETHGRASLLRPATPEEKKLTGKDLFPKGWEVKTLGTICNVIPGYAFKKDDWSRCGIPVLKIKNINSDNTINTDDTDFIPEKLVTPQLEKFKLNNRDFLIAMTGATAGKVGRLRTNIPFLLNQRVAKIIPRDIYHSLVWCFISTEEQKKRFYRLADGAAQPNMSGSQIEGLKLVVPGDSICEAFSYVVDNIFNQTDNLYLKNTNLRRTRDLLLPKLISGEIDVEELDIAV